MYTLSGCRNLNAMTVYYTFVNYNMIVACNQWDKIKMELMMYNIY